MLEQFDSIFSALISFTGLLLVVRQMRESTKQRRLESLHQVYGINRELLALGFAHPELFDIINDRKADPEKERRYLQCWLNQFSLINSMLRSEHFDPEFEKGLKRDIAGFMANRNMKRHWEYARHVYPASFQELVDRILEEAGAEAAVTRPEPAGRSARRSPEAYGQNLLRRVLVIGRFRFGSGGSPERKRRRRRSK